jgi:hypothetical protein
VHLPLSRELLYTEITTRQQIENTSVDPQHPDLTLLDCSYRCSSRVIELSLFKPSLTLISSSLSSASSLLLAVFITSLLLVVQRTYVHDLLSYLRCCHGWLAPVGNENIQRDSPTVI